MNQRNFIKFQNLNAKHTKILEKNTFLDFPNTMRNIHTIDVFLLMLTVII